MPFGFTFDCGAASAPSRSPTASSFTADRCRSVTSCTVTETGVPPTPARRTGGTRRSSPSTAVPSGAGNSVTFPIPRRRGASRSTSINPITRRSGSVPSPRRSRADRRVRLRRAAVHRHPHVRRRDDLRAGRSRRTAAVTQAGIPVGSTCTASESAPAGGLVDESYAWGPPTYAPADATVTVAPGATGTVDGDQPDRPRHRAGPARQVVHRAARRRRSGADVSDHLVLHVRRHRGRQRARRRRRRPRRGRARVAPGRPAHVGVHGHRGRPRRAVGRPGVPLAAAGDHRHDGRPRPGRTRSPSRTPSPATAASCGCARW